MLQRLAEIGMQLAERAAEEALQEPPAEAPKRRRPDPTLLFIRLSAMVRACITLQLRLAAGKIPPAPRARRQTSSAAVPHNTIEAPPEPKAEPTEIQRAVESLINEYLEIDPDLRHDSGHAIKEICQEFGISHDMARTRKDHHARQKVNTAGHGPP